MLKNTYKKGNILEAQFSKYIHINRSPVLVSSKLLREFGCGQIDLCTYLNGKLIIHEIKSRPEGLSRKQTRRLYNSLDLLCQVFKCSGRLEILNHLPKD